MTARAASVLCVVSLASVALAQAAAGAGGSAEQYVGVVTATDVNVRCFPDADNSYPCVRLSYPSKVTVVGKRGEWLKIAPPPGTFSLVRKADAKPDAEGKTATIVGKIAWAYAGGQARTSDYWAVQCRLHTGEKVEIVGQVTAGAEQWYKIRCPYRARYWIAAKYVRRLAGAAVPPVTAATKPGATRTVPSVRGGATADARLAEFRKLEDMLHAEVQKPADQQDLQAVLAAYRKMDLKGAEYVRPFFNARVEYLEALLNRRKQIAAVRAAVAGVLAQHKEGQAGREKLSMVPEVVPYDAEGILRASEIYNIGGPMAPKRFYVTDPGGSKVKAYVQCTTGVLNLGKYVSKRVGVFGPKHYDRSVGRYVVEAERIVVLPGGPAARLKPTLPPVPKAKPAPPVVPKAKPTPPVVPKAKPAPPVVPKAKPAPPVVPKAKPRVLPDLKPRPRFEPTTRPKPAVTTRPKPKVTTKPAPKTLPKSGLPAAKSKPASKPVIDEREFD